MPSRWLRWLIVLFWLATTGWLFWNDVRPKWRTGEPPPFSIDDVEEVRKDQYNNPMPIFWTVQRANADGTYPVNVFHASTWVDYDKNEETFTINAKLDASKAHGLKPVDVAKILKIDVLTSAYRVNRSGQLLALEATVKAHFKETHLPLFSLLPRFDPSEQISLRIWAEVRERQFFAHCEAVARSLSKPMRLDLPPAEVSYTGSVLMPLHPVNHIRGLRPGQSWRQPLVDPIRDALASFPGFSGGVHWLNARVLSQPRMLDLNGNLMTCLAIEYSNDEDEIVGRTWVEQESEQVQQQEAFHEDGRWIMKRDLQRHSREKQN
ncbi:MAG: hypothetical protein ACYC3I_04920 [Gemmataceae bacterium]